LHHVKDRSWYEDWQYTKFKNTGFALGIFRNISLNIIRVLFDHKNKSKESMPKKALKLLCNPIKTMKKIMKI